MSSVQWRQAYVGYMSLAHLAQLQVSLREARPLGRSGRSVLYLGSVGGRTVLTADRGAALLGSLPALLAHQKFGEIRNGRLLRAAVFSKNLRGHLGAILAAFFTTLAADVGSALHIVVLGWLLTYR